MKVPHVTRGVLNGLLASLILSACGGGGGSSTPAPVTTAPVTMQAPVPVPSGVAPQVTGDTATDGLNWFNYRRQLLGEPVLSRTATIDTAAQGHARYQALNDTITHTQVASNPGFTGVALADRLTAAGYRFTGAGHAYGEVISSTSDPSGVNAAEDLITAIYHRFVIFEPMFRQAGAGNAMSSSGRNYFTVDFTVDGLPPALGAGKFVVYPVNGQQSVLTVFYSDYESPDPVPNRNQVGFPVSLHADITSTVTVQSFTIQPRNGTPLATQLLAHASDPETPTSAAAIVPLDVLAAGTTYDVRFIGAVDGVPVDRSWSFTTR